MKEKIAKILTIAICVAAGFELVNLAFWLMNQPNTLFFWAGVFLAGSITSIAGWYLMSSVATWYSKTKAESESTTEDDDKTINL